MASRQTEQPEFGMISYPPSSYHSLRPKSTEFLNWSNYPTPYRAMTPWTSYNNPSYPSTNAAKLVPATLYPTTMSSYNDPLDSHLPTTIMAATFSPFLRTPNPALNPINRVEPPRDGTSVKVEGQNQHEANDFLTELSCPWPACKAEELREADSFSKALPRPGPADQAFEEESYGNQVRLSDVMHLTTVIQFRSFAELL
ncbi:hypothetical protein BDW72DRAFT_168902 [Aspergillus terricola var. indicus]